MQVFKWGDDLAVCLPKILVDELGLKEGEELEIFAAEKGRVMVKKVDRRAEFLRRAESFRFPLPEGYKFDRDETNER